MVEICGKAGTILLVDTSGFHKGKELGYNKHRIMLQTEFGDASSQFGRRITN